MKNILVFLFLVSIVTAQDKKLEMRITYPSDGDSLNISKARLGAWISDTLASVKINGKDTKVYGSGAFVDLFELKPGWNQFIISAKNKINTISDTLNLYRNLPLASLPQSPTIFSKEKILPSSDLIFYDQDKLIVQFMGSPGGKASFEIDDLVDDPLPMMELPENQAGGLKGIYQGEYQIKNTDACVREEIIFYLEGKDSNEEELESDRFVTVKQTGQPFLVETKDESNLVFYRPGSEIFMELPQGIKLPVIVEYNRGFKIEVAPGKSGVISKNSVNVLPQGQVTPHAALYGIASGFENDWLVFSFNLTDKIPFKIIQNAQPQSVDLVFYRTHFQDEWSVYPVNDHIENPDSSFLNHFSWRQNSDEEIQFTFFLNTPQQWGFRGWYDGNHFKLAMRKPPVIESDSLFKNLNITLDAGHGGEHRGAVGATGYMEKDANLKYTKYLYDMLKDAGAKVFLTRSVDTTMNLKPRADIGRENNSHILVWMHNNSTGFTSHPLDVKGTSTYYTHLQGWPFARYVYPELVKIGLEPFGRIHRSYYITRQPDMVIFLVEGAFHSNPYDEMFLLNDENLKKLAQGVFNGMERYLRTLAK